ncbi:hypothetical protein [Streptomyces colonosanans]|nr:hypothetical protein [Streptomyces colonosanans]
MRYLQCPAKLGHVLAMLVERKAEEAGHATVAVVGRHWTFGRDA